MKKLITKVAAIAVLSAGAMLAQSPLQHGFGFGVGLSNRNGNGNEDGNGNGNGNGSTGTPSIATIVAHEVTFLTHLLDLSASQQTQATTIFTAALTSITPLQANITTARTALNTAIKANDTAGITTQATAI